MILNGAASYGRLEILEWALERGYSHANSEEMSICAVEHGHLAALILLKDHGCPVAREFGYPAMVDSKWMPME